MVFRMLPYGLEEEVVVRAWKAEVNGFIIHFSQITFWIIVT